MPVTLAVVNDYPLVVAGVRAVLEPYADRVRVTEVALGSSVTGGVDVVLHDTFGNPEQPMGDPRPHRGPGAPRRVVFSWDTDPRQVRAAVEAGADGYVAKTVSADELVEAIERVHRGERVLPEGAEDPEDAPVLGRWPGDEHGLSPRESEVLALICEGLSNVEISQRAYIGINTVKTYIRSAYRKIGVTTRPQAVIWAMSNGFEGRTEHRVLDRSDARDR
ncbi:response regulator transcription factor [Nocardioides sp. AX2bis]|uniref:response regulator transcription factor n=1 Tax=Nocardioides sp. AX2bis TaxID=2653157 RepID=UPI0012F2669B|nr:response regulator transcription factor [Nocardioides sp. AX2bis]VXB28214.1 Helix-turn-helix transcriptional regulator [Nocardioides sp. AX2bis]